MAEYDRAALVKEATFSTKPALTNAEWLEFLSESFAPKHTVDLQQGSYYDVPTREGLGRYSWGGGLTMKMGPENGLGMMLRNLFGAPTAVAGATVANQFTYTSPGAVGYGSSLSTVLTRTMSTGQKQFDYAGGAVSKLGIEAVVNQDIRLSPEFMGDKDSMTGTLDTPPSPLDRGEFFRHHDSIWQIGGAPATDLDVSAWSVNIESDTEVVPAINSRFGRRIFRGGLNLTGRMDRDFVDSLYYSRFYGSDSATAPLTTLTAQNIVIDIIGEATGDATFANFRFKIEFPKVKIFETTANLSNRDRITQGVPFVVLRDPAVAYAARFTLVNKRAVTFYA